MRSDVGADLAGAANSSSAPSGQQLAAPAQRALHLGVGARREPQREVVDARVAGQALVVARVDRDRAELARVVAPHAAHKDVARAAVGSGSASCVPGRAP